MSDYEHKAFRLKLEGMDDEAGTFTGYASVFGNQDLDGEVVDRGAFTKTIGESGGVVPILWQHDPYDPIGFSTSLEEDEHGLKVTGALNLDVENGRHARALMRQAQNLGAKFGLSIGYRIVQDGIVDKVRHLKELALREFSPVTFPANTLAGVAAIKTAEDAKAGRVLSAASLSQIDAAIEALQALRASAEVDEGAADSDDEPAKATRDANIQQWLEKEYPLV